VPLPPLDELGRPSGGPLNRRAEMWMKSKAWLELIGGVQVPDSDSLQADACGPSYRYDALLPKASGSTERFIIDGAVFSVEDEDGYDKAGD